MRLLYRAAFILTFLITVPSIADERILSFDADLTVRADGSVDVRERITVSVEGNRIKRGIFREIPTRYIGPAGTNLTVSLDVKDVSMDGRDVRWRVENIGAGKSIRIGNANKYLSHGEHTFTILYTTSRVLLFHDDRDELYWNVTGNGWNFAINEVTARVHLPSGATISDVTAFTGSQRSKAKDYEVTEIGTSSATITTTRRLGRHQGMSIAVTWPAGVVYRPTESEKRLQFLMDNLSLFIGAIGSLVLIFIFYTVWSKYGRDPEGGTIIPQYDPPKGMSPATCRYVLKMGYSSAAVSAAIVSLAVKGYISIHEKGKSVTLTKTGNEADLSVPERALAGELFQSNSTIKLGEDYSESFVNAISLFKGALKKSEIKYFASNTLKKIGGMTLALLITSLGLVVSSTISEIYLIFVGLNLISCVVFLLLMKAPTEFGRGIMDEIEGFKLYLGKAEKDRMNFHNPPDKTPELFEKYLPFAIALDVENEWGEQFDDVLARAAAFSGEEGYHPSWYHGYRRSRRFSSRSFTNGLNSSLSSSIATASTAPTTSGGGGGGGFSSGGGFSGGGFGGGGGGGW